jgi:hypothetical protein
MKFFFTIAILLLCNNIFAQQKTFNINNVKFFTIKKNEKTEYDCNDKFVNIYYSLKGKKQFLCKYYTYRYGADCNNVFTDIGTIEIKNDRLILKTHFKQKGKLHDPIPDWEKRIYKVYKNGKVLLVYNKTFQNGKWNAVL